MVTKKGNSLFDDIDLKILQYLSHNKPQVLELAYILGINHKNLKPHIEKLILLNYVIYSEDKYLKNTESGFNFIKVLESAYKIKYCRLDLRNKWIDTIGFREIN